jgi:diamine N-acetyltransferase
MVELRALTRDNWVACADLPLLPSQQGLLAPNVYSIAELNFVQHYTPRVIYASGQLVGFLMYCPENDPPDSKLFWLFRFMVAAEHQSKGYGASALRLALLEMKAAGATHVRTMHKPRNSPASKLYRKHGFVEIGVLTDGDLELELSLEAPSRHQEVTANPSIEGTSTSKLCLLSAAPHVKR